MGKSLVASKTFWINMASLAGGAVTLITALQGTLPPNMVPYASGAIIVLTGVVNIINRFYTEMPIDKVA